MKRFLTYFLIACLAVSTTGCGLFTPAEDPSSMSDAQKAAKVAFGFAKAGLSYLTEEVASHIDTLEDPEEIEKAALMVQSLRRAKTSLELAEPYVTGERKGEADLKTYIADAADALLLVADELKARGVKIPGVIVEGLKLAASYART